MQKIFFIIEKNKKFVRAGNALYITGAVTHSVTRYVGKIFR